MAVKSSSGMHVPFFTHTHKHTPCLPRVSKVHLFLREAFVCSPLTAENKLLVDIIFTVRDNSCYLYSGGEKAQKTQLKAL